MSSVNQYPTFQYTQPAEYRFSHDSVFLSRFVFEQELPNIHSGIRLLDVCSGCGVVGLDFLWHLKNEGNIHLSSADFLEVQSVYEPFFQQNILSSGIDESQTRFKFINSSYDSLLTAEYSNKYDLILSNPPYFQLGQGRLSPSEFKNRCRFFVDSDLRKLIFGILNSLAPKGSAYILLRPLKDHGVDSFQDVLRFQSDYQLEKGDLFAEIKIVTNIRGTDVVLIKK